MGLEERNGNKYYYNKVRRGGRVVSVYFAGGELAILAAEVDRILAAERLVGRLTEAVALEDSAAVGDLVGAYCAGVDAIAAEAMEAAGYHRHRRGEWRKRRGR